MYSYDRRIAIEPKYPYPRLKNPKKYADETTAQITETLTDFLHPMLDEIMRKKGISPSGFWEFNSHRELTKLVEKYVNPFIMKRTLKANDGDMQAIVDLGDLDEFQREVLVPLLQDGFRQKPKYPGFGPKSVTMKLKRIDKLPFYAVMSKRVKVFQKFYDGRLPE